jgi:hypothetical protein
VEPKGHQLDSYHYSTFLRNRVESAGFEVIGKEPEMGSIIGRGRYAGETYPEKANGGGSGGSILPFEAVFGNGTDGAVVTPPGAVASLGGNFTTFTLSAGTTLKPPPGRNLIIIRATERIVLDGKIDASGATTFATSGMVWYGSSPPAFGGGGGGGGGSATSPANSFGGIIGGNGGPIIGFTPPTLGNQGNDGAPGNIGFPGGPGGAASPSSPGAADPAFAQQVALWLSPIIFTGGAPGSNGIQGTQGGPGAPNTGNGGNPGNGGNGGVGGDGGGFIFLIAPSIVFGAACELHADGTVGTAGVTGSPGGDAPAASNGGGGGAGGGGGGGGGGCGGVIIARAGTFSGPGPLAATVAGGVGGALGAGGAPGGAADGTGQPGGIGGDSATGPTGTTGIVLFSPI